MRTTRSQLLATRSRRSTFAMSRPGPQSTRSRLPSREKMSSLPEPPSKTSFAVAPRRSGKELARMLTAMGYEPNTVFNATNGNRRLLFYDAPPWVFTHVTSAR